MKAKFISSLAASFAIFTISEADAAIAYLRSNIGEPWVSSTNISAMDTAFGSGNWSSLYFQTADTAILFSPTFHFIFIDGSAWGANARETFLDTNSTLITSWVNMGGDFLSTPHLEKVMA